MNQEINEVKEGPVRLMQYSHGAGCGCKIAPAVLQEMLRTDEIQPVFGNLLVGNETNDDAAAYDLGDGRVLISTTDFFMPIVDDAYDFGRVAAANAISDVYAMGGSPLLALAILGWPMDKLPANLAGRVLDGARAICREANIPLAGGHSIDSREPIFGLAVNGLCDAGQLKRNNTAKENDLLFLTKALGTGIVSTAQKRGACSPEHHAALVAQLTRLNKIGTELGKIPGVHAMTDVTGFGLAGHLTEMAAGSGLSAVLSYSHIRLLDGVRDYLAQRIQPDATFRNWNAYGKDIAFDDGVDIMEAFSLLPDPQTNGGLLVAVASGSEAEVVSLFRENGLEDFTQPIGHLVAKTDKVIRVSA